MQRLAADGTAVLIADDPRVVAMRSLTDGPVLTFGRAEHADVRALDLALDRLGQPSRCGPPTLRLPSRCRSWASTKQNA